MGQLLYHKHCLLLSLNSTVADCHQEVYQVVISIYFTIKIGPKTLRSYLQPGGGMVMINHEAFNQLKMLTKISTVVQRLRIPSFIMFDIPFATGKIGSHDVDELTELDFGHFITFWLGRMKQLQGSTTTASLAEIIIMVSSLQLFLEMERPNAPSDSRSA